MDVVKTFAIYIAAAIGELGGTYCYWRWLKGHGPWGLAILGIVALVGYAVVQTYQPEIKYGRVYAAYAGVFLAGLGVAMVSNAFGRIYRRPGALLRVSGIILPVFAASTRARARRQNSSRSATGSSVGAPSPASPTASR